MATDSKSERYSRSGDVSAVGTDFVNNFLSSKDYKGFVELASPDCFVRWRVRRTLDKITRTHYIETGPASKSSLPVLGGVDIAPYVMAILNAQDTVSQITGAYTAGGQTRAAKVICAFSEDDPYAIESQIWGFHTGGDESSIAASGNSSRIYPRGYADTFRFTGYDSTGTVTGEVRGYSRGQNEVYREALSSSGGSLIHPWTGLTVFNTGAGTLSGSLSFFSRASA
jgi:hypothetical protein